MSSVRSFVAIELDTEMRQVLARAIARLEAREGGQLVRWVSPESVHLTLKFLGDIQTSQVPSVSRALDQVAPGHAPLRLELDDVRCFPNPRRARVFWVGIKDEHRELQALVESLEDALKGLGFPRERRPFVAHLTLGRVRRRSDPSRVASLTEASVSDICQGKVLTADAISLMQSELTPSGAIYSRLHRAVLAG